MHRIALIVLLFYFGSVGAYSIPAVARIYKLMADFENFAIALEKHGAEQGSYPNSEQGLKLLVPLYVEALPTDPWGRKYMYEAKKNVYRVWSFGRDGMAGGVGEDFDYSSDTTTENIRHREHVLSENTSFFTWSILSLVLVILGVFFSLYYLVMKAEKMWHASKSE